MSGFQNAAVGASGAASGDLSGSFPAPAVVKINGVGARGAYTQTFTTAARTHAASALSTTVVVALLTDVPALFNTTNSAVNELKGVVNSLIDDLQAFGLVG